MTKTLFIIAFLLVNYTYSQGNNLFIRNNPQSTGIDVKWVSKDLLYKEGVNVYRSENGGGFQKIATLIPPSSIPPEFSEKQNMMYNSFLNMTKEQYQESFDIIFTVMEVIEQNDFAKKIGLAYTDESVTLGNTYQYKIESITNGITNEIGTTQIIKAASYEPINAPQNFEFKRERKNTKITWDNNTDKYYTYTVYMKNQENTEWDTLINNFSSAGLLENKKDFYLNPSTDKDSAYEFKIEAVDYFGAKTQMSEIFTLKVIDLDPPSTPEVRTATYAKDKKIILTWDKPVDKDVIGYNILRSTEENDSIYTLINTQLISSADTSFNDVVNDPGIYLYRLQVVDTAENKSNTFPYMVELYDVFAPDAPTNLKAKADTGKLILSWDKVAAPDLKGYQLMRSVADEDNSDNLYVPVSPSYFDTNYYVEEIAKNVRNPFVYIVKAVDTFLNISEASNTAIVQLPDVTPPKAPFIKQTYEENGYLAINWIPNVELDLKGYNIYKRKKGDTTQFEQLNISLIPPSLEVYVDKEAQRGQFYEYKLMAKDQAGLNSPFSNEVLGKLEYLELAGTIKITKNKLNKNRQEVIIEWDTDSLVNEAIVGSSVYRAYENEMPLPATKVIEGTRFKQKLEKPGKYTYHIRAFGERGNLIKSETIEFNITTNE